MVQLPPRFLDCYQQEQLQNLPSCREAHLIEPIQYWQSNNCTLSNCVQLFEIELYGLVIVLVKNSHLSKVKNSISDLIFFDFERCFY